MKAQHRVAMYSIWAARIGEVFTTETCDQVTAEFASMFSAQPTRVRELRTQHMRSLNMALEAWGTEIVASMQRIYQRMMAENIMKSGREGLLEEMGKTRESILNQLSHPDSGLRSDTQLVFLCQHLSSLGQRWAELERSLAQEARRESRVRRRVSMWCLHWSQTNRQQFGWKWMFPQKIVAMNSCLIDVVRCAVSW